MKGGLRLDLREFALHPAKSGKPAVVPGHPEASELVHRILTTDDDDAMPPSDSHKTLSAAQKELLQRWIAQGAEYQGHWSYSPPVKAPAPTGPTAIDYLVRTRGSELGLQPAPEADPRTLVRRLYFDLTGLPPDPEEVSDFERDSTPDVYLRLVERLLASPHFGERMAIGWLDIVRYADTIGYHSDTPRNIWPYRDYVIRSFNNNKPFDQFTREQLAGDLLPEGTLEQRVASGFNRLLLTTEEGGAQPKDYEARYLTDRVRAIGAVWLGQTIGCAQCHDHKFDPITARDFYSMGAFFADVNEAIIGRREDGLLVPSAAQAPELARHEKTVQQLQQNFDASHPELAEAYIRWQHAQLAVLEQDARWTQWAPALAESTGGAKLKVREDRSVLVSGTNAVKDDYLLRFTNEVAAVIGLRLEAIPEDSLPAKGPGRAENGNFVLTEVVARVERVGQEARRLPFQSAAASIEQSILAENNPYHRWSAASVIDGDRLGDSAGWAILPEVGKPQQLVLRFQEPLTVASNETLVVELQQRHGNKGHNLGHFRLSGTALEEAFQGPLAFPPTPEISDLLKISTEKRDPSKREKLFTHFKNLVPELGPLRKELAAARQVKTEFEARIPRSLVTERAEKPRTVRILPRGNWMVETGDVVEPALPAFLVKGSVANAAHPLTRLDLANWLVGPENPLTARVVINRFWRQFFGQGLSKVLDDFGAQGETPPNQALLDWLACEFRDSGWDVKHMVRLMVLSHTYRQDSRASHDVLARDPENRGLARQGRWRVDAEMVRDTALSIAGLLERTVGGPSANPYQPGGYWENLNFPVRAYEASSGALQYRRGLYTWWQRSYLHPSLLAFDAPTREECAAERNRSNIPQQALVLLNDPSYVEAARSFAARILLECRGDDTARLTWAWRQVVSREPTTEELSTLRSLLEKHLGEFQQNPTAAARYLKVGAIPPPAELDPAVLAAWTDIARALLNLHETITRS